MSIIASAKIAYLPRLLFPIRLQTAIWLRLSLVICRLRSDRGGQAKPGNPRARRAQRAPCWSLFSVGWHVTAAHGLHGSDPF